MEKGERIERNTDIRMKCHKCGCEFTMNMMRMDSDGKKLICKACLERYPSSPQAASKALKKTIDDQEVTHYFCKQCKYSFKRASHLDVKTCPYCNSSNSVVTKGSTARILSDASKMKG